MGLNKTYKEIEEMTIEQKFTEFNVFAGSNSGSISFWQDAIQWHYILEAQNEMKASQKEMKQTQKIMKNISIGILIMSLANLGFVIFNLYNV